MSNWLWPGSVVTHVVDGDTFDAMVTRDLGFDGTATFPIRLRLNRINCPPAKTVEGQAATSAASQMLMGTPTVLIETLRTYKYGGGEHSEWMAEVTLPTGRNVSDELVAQGHAVFWDGTGPRPGG